MFNIKKWNVLIAIAALCISGCSKPSSPYLRTVDALPSPPVAVQSPNDQKDKDLYIEVSALNRLDYFKNHKLGLSLAGAALDVDTEYVGPDDYDLDAMKQEFLKAISRHPSGIVVVGFDGSLAPLVDEATEAGIPVVTVDSDLPGSNRIAYVGTGNHQAGYEGAQKLAELIGGVGKIALMSLPGQPNLDDRVQGYKDALRNYPKIELVSVIDTQSNADVGAKELIKVLAKYPDLAGIGCVEAAGGSGAIKAMMETGKKSQIKIVAMDNDRTVINGIENDIISATVVQQTALMSFYAVQILYNRTHALPFSNLENQVQNRGMPMMIDTGVVIMDKSNYKRIMLNK